MPRESLARREPWMRAIVKRGLDVAIAGVALVVALPILALAAVAIRRSLGPGVLFRQERPGLHGVPFTLYKLRTMADPVDASGQVLTEYARVPPLGRMLRTSSVDELPQLWNVLKGEMSLVGPRPLLTQYLERYSPEQARRHDVRPGLTGWAQVHRRTAATWDEKLRLDVWYVDHHTLALDLLILIKTVRDLLSRRGSPAMDSLSRTTDNELEFGSGKAASGRSGMAMRSDSDP